jgi:hypothetical protein
MAGSSDLLRVAGSGRSPNCTCGGGTQAARVGNAVNARRGRNPLRWKNPAGTTTGRRAVHGRPSSAEPACGAIGSQATSCPGSISRVWRTAWRPHRLATDQADHVLAAWLDPVAAGLARHEEDTVLHAGTPDADLLSRHGKNVQEGPAMRRVRSSACPSHRTLSFGAPSERPRFTARPSGPKR